MGLSVWGFECLMDVGLFALGLDGLKGCGLKGFRACGFESFRALGLMKKYVKLNFSCRFCRVLFCSSNSFSQFLHFSLHFGPLKQTVWMQQC